MGELCLYPILLHIGGGGQDLVAPPHVKDNSFIYIQWGILLTAVESSVVNHLPALTPYFGAKVVRSQESLYVYACTFFKGDGRRAHPWHGRELDVRTRAGFFHQPHTNPCYVRRKETYCFY